jgi:hemoglobin
VTLSAVQIARDSSDIMSRADLECLVDAFYERVRADEILGPIFDDVAHTDWDRHLPRMYDFWNAVVFGAGSFSGNPLAVHRELGSRVVLGGREFGRWLSMFHQTVDSRFAGQRAEEIKTTASRIAAVMQHHIVADRDTVTPA